MGEEPKFTFLDNKQILDNQINIIKFYGRCSALTDFAILLGGYVNVYNQTGWWWTKNFSSPNSAFVIDDFGYPNILNTFECCCGARPAIPYFDIIDKISKKIDVTNKISEVEYGKYPQTIVNEDFSGILENEYKNNDLKLTGKSYTINWPKNEKRKIIEYEFNGKKYIRFVCNHNRLNSKLSDGRSIIKGRVYWLQVEPIVWLVDHMENLALSKKILFSGIPFDNWLSFNSDFNLTNLKKFMDFYFSKEILDMKEIKIDELQEQNVIRKRMREIYKRI